MTINVTGKIVEILQAKSGVSRNGNEWTNQEFVLEEDDKNRIVFNVFGAQKIAEYNLQVGSTAAVTLKVESTSWNGKYFTKLSCIGCVSNTSNQQQQQAPQPRPIQTPNLDAAKEASTSAQGIDALPF
jgi:hypothetical protein